MLVKFRDTDLEHNPVFEDVVDENARWFRDGVEAYMSQLVDESRLRSRMPEWMHQVWNLGPDRLAVADELGEGRLVHLELLDADAVPAVPVLDELERRDDVPANVLETVLVTRAARNAAVVERLSWGHTCVIYTCVHT